MFARIDDVRWETLINHPHAERVPELVRKLISQERKERQIGVGSLMRIFAHQGNADPASVAVIPFLHEVALSVDVEDRARVVELLADLAAGGNHENVVGSGIDPEAPWLRRELYDAVARRAGEYLPLLTEDDAQLRAATAMLLALLSDHAESVAVALRNRIGNEKTVSTRASMLVGLGMAAKQLGTDEDSEAFEAALKHRSKLVKLGGACGLVYIGERLQSAATAHLVGVIGAPLKSTKGFPWHHGDAGQLALRVLLDACIRNRKVSPLLNLLDQHPDLNIAAGLVRAAFPRRDTMLLPRELSDEQRVILHGVSAFNTATDELFTALNARGFVAAQHSLKRFSGALDAGPLDCEIEGVPLWKVLRDFMDDDRTLADILAVFSKLSPKEVLAACEDALTHYMSLHLPFPRPFFPDAFRNAAGYGKLGRLCADIIVKHVPAEQLEERLVSLAAQPKPAHSRVCAALLAAYATVADADDAQLVRFDTLMVNSIKVGAQAVLRGVFARLDIDHRAKLVLAKQPAFVWNGSGYVYHGCVPYLDLVPTAEAAEVAVNALTTRRDPPMERFVDILVAVGAPAKAAIDGALAGEHADAVRDALERARAAISG